MCRPVLNGQLANGHLDEFLAHTREDDLGVLLARGVFRIFFALNGDDRRRDGYCYSVAADLHVIEAQDGSTLHRPGVRQ
jgi:hypothetical protein